MSLPPAPSPAAPPPAAALVGAARLAMVDPDGRLLTISCGAAPRRDHAEIIAVTG